jgi:geranylgeranyl pyrophosphate synthase
MPYLCSILEKKLISTDFYTPVQVQLTKVDALMRAQAENYHPDLQNALDLILSSGGKRIRATLTLLAGKILGAEENRLITLASAIEMLHTATLVHDDLIDGSLLRRGMPTLNSQWSPGATVLTGDFLFARAAKLASDTYNIEVMRIFSETLGVIVNGEIAQLFSTHNLTDRDIYFSRIYAKTASLFETACKATALLNHCSQEVQETMGLFGYNLGIAFQIVDDILDFNGEQGTLGKPIGSDLRQGILTLPVLYYLDQFPSDTNVIHIKSHGCLTDNNQMHIFIQDIRTSNVIENAQIEAKKYITAALTALSTFPTSTEKSALEELALYITNRNY